MTMLDEGDSYPHEFAGEEASPPVQPTPAEVAEGIARRTAERIEAGELYELPPWRLARSITTLRNEANHANPNRDRRSDGTIGDAAHASRASDHNPWLQVAGFGVVRAVDLDVDGLDLPGAFERARAAAHAGRLPQLAGGGYLILNRRITAPDFTHWRTYTGPNPHTGHGHVSVSRDPAGFDSAAGWGILAPTPAPVPPPLPTPGGWTGPDLTGTAGSLRGAKGHNGPRVRTLQSQLRSGYPLYARHLGVDGWWGDQTSGVLREFARRSGIAADGYNIGPKIANALTRGGVRP